MVEAMVTGGLTVLAFATLLAFPAAAQWTSTPDLYRPFAVNRCRLAILQAGKVHYPKAAREQRIYGSVKLTTIFSDTGRVIDINVDRSSGSTILDDAAAGLVRIAAPCEIAQSRTSFTRTFVFQPSENGDLFHDHEKDGPGQTVFSDAASYAVALRKKLIVGTFRALPRSTKAVVELTISPIGLLEQALIRESSGYELYDRGILDSARAAQPYPVMEEWLVKGTPQKVNLVVRLPEP